MHQDILRDFGLTENEIKLYLALLDWQSSAASTLSRKTGIKRLSTYAILNSLKEKGFITSFKKENITYFSALEPEGLLNVCETSIASEKKKRDELLSFVKEFQKNSKKISLENMPSVKFFEGIEGIKKAYENTLNSPEEILVYTNIDLSEKSLKEFMPVYYQKRKKKNIIIKYVTDSGSEINIYGNKILIISFEEKTGILIESSEIAKTLKQILEFSYLGFNRK